MSQKKIIEPGASVWHPSLKKTFKGCAKWMKSVDEGQWLENLSSDIRKQLAKDERLKPSARGDLQSMGHAYGVWASDSSVKENLVDLPALLSWAVQFNMLGFRVQAFHNLQPSNQGIPLKFSTSMKVAGSAMLSHWRETEIGAGC